MLEGLSKPVVLTGSMIPFAESIRTREARPVMALTGAAGPSGSSCFLRSITPGNRTTKVDALLYRRTTRRIFLRSPCGVALELDTTWRWRRHHQRDKSVHTDGDKNIGISHGARVRRKALLPASSRTN